MTKVSKRHLDISVKIGKMGEALIKEGTESHDYEITRAGHSMTFISGLVLSAKDTEEFGFLCEMFAAKKTLEQLEDTNPTIKKYLNRKFNNESFNDFLGRGGDVDDEEKTEE